MSMNDSLLARLEGVQQRIATAAQRSGRHASDITLIAVTKTHPAEVVQAAYALGLRDFGENRVEGLKERHTLGLDDVRWHMIGHVQSRKVKEVLALANVVHSVDRLSVAEEISNRLSASALEKPLSTSPVMDILLQVNVSGEASKGGWHLTEPQAWDGFVAEVAQVVALPGVRVRGFMTMAPYDENSEKTRPIFAQLRRVQERAQTHFPDTDFQWLSMGMTNDYEIAIEEGATHVRIGTALFGERV